MIDNNVKVVPSDAQECLVCDVRAEPCGRESLIRVTFDVKLPWGLKAPVSEFMHVACAKELRALLDRRIAEAEKVAGA